MNTELWRKAQAIFDEAVSLETETALNEFLHQACGDDKELKTKVESLLESNATGSLDGGHILGQALSAYESNHSESMCGVELGKYRLGQPIGRGGMGVVYLAKRDDFHREVAVKVLNFWTNEAEHQKRFLMERQVLASLDHPNIAGLLDGGSTAEGQPYLVMEFIEGQNILDYCEKEKLSLDERLDLFLAVCSAVSHAHAKLVVHRDIKPSNILMDQQGRPKLLDFGIAKLLGDLPGWDDLEQTRTGVHLFSPRHASPEQLRGDPITVSCDVHGLGILLYELISGVYPFEDEAQNREKLEKAVLYKEVRPPSQVSASPIAPDLDAIVLQALRKDPVRRYSSVAALAEDVSRSKAGHPVTARPDTAAYRIKKFVGRHTWAVGSAALAFVLLISFTAITLYQASQLSQERDRAVEAQRHAETVTQFLVDTYKVADPRGRNGTVDALALLEDGVRKLDYELEDQPRLRAALLNVYGAVYTNLGEFDRAEPLLSEALGLRLSDSSLANAAAEVYSNQSRLAWARGDFKNAAEAQKEALVVLKNENASLDQVTAAKVLLAQIYRDAGKYEEVSVLLDETLGYYKEHRIRSRISAETHNLAGLFHTDMGNYEKGRVLLETSLEMYDEVLGDTHPLIAEALNNLGLMYSRMGDVDRSRTYMEQAFHMRKKVWGEKHINTAHGMMNLAYSAMMQKEFDEAEDLYKKALDLHNQLHINDHLQTSYALHGLGHFYSVTLQLELAEDYLLDALEMKRRLLEPDHPDLAASISALAQVYIKLERYSEAETLLLEALESDLNNLGESHFYVAADRLVLAHLSLLQNNLYRGLELLALCSDALWKEDPVMGLWGDSLIAWCRYEMGETLDISDVLEDAYYALRDRFGEGSYYAQITCSRWHLSLGDERFASVE